MQNIFQLKTNNCIKLVSLVSILDVKPSYTNEWEQNLIVKEAQQGTDQYLD